VENVACTEILLNRLTPKEVPKESEC